MTVENLHETKAAENYATSSYYECVVTDTVTGESVPLEISFGGMTTPSEHDALMFLPESMMPKKWVKAFAKEYWGK
jgi:hypothetical protein